MATLSWRFSVGLVSLSARYGISSLLVWVKSTVGWMMAPISHSETSCISSSLLMCTARYSVLSKLVDEFLVYSKYSESPSLPPKLAANMLSLSGLAGGMGYAF